jgi:hypothetical protein
MGGLAVVLVIVVVIIIVAIARVIYMRLRPPEHTDQALDSVDIPTMYQWRA